MELANFNNFNSVAAKFKQNKDESKKLESKINKYIQDNTTEEKQQLEAAIKNYNNKIKSVMSKRQNEIDQINNYHTQMNETLQQTYDAFYDATNKILQNNNLSNDQKEKKIQQISEYIMNNLYTKEEIDQFKKFASQFEILLPGNNYTKKVKNIKDSPNSKLSIRYS